jgi:MFS family permease
VRVSIACLELALGLIPKCYPADGRRSIYLWGMPFLCVGSYGVGLSTSLRSLLFWRFVQTFGCSGGIPLGAGVIGDIYKLEERGTAIGVFFGVSDSDIEGSCRFGTNVTFLGHTFRVRCCSVPWR